jgi:glycine oxidase
VIGAGPIGLASAWRLAQRGHVVTVYDDGRDGAYSAAAGLIVPGDDPVLLDSSDRWPAFAGELDAERIAYARSGSVSVPLDGGETAYNENDAQVDPRMLVWRLRLACRQVGVSIRPGHVAHVSEVDSEVTVVAAGVGSADLVGVPVRPVRGETVRLRGGPALPHIVRGYAEDREVYILQRPTGEIVIGATTTPGPPEWPLAGSVHDLLRDAFALVPALREAHFHEAAVGLRPATPDGQPIVAWVRPRVIAATGHYRNGIALTPWAADTVADLVSAL